MSFSGVFSGQPVGDGGGTTPTTPTDPTHLEDSAATFGEGWTADDVAATTELP